MIADRLDNVRPLNIAPRPTALNGPLIVEERGVRTAFVNAEALLEHMLDGQSPMARRMRREAQSARTGAAMIAAADKAAEAREAEWAMAPWPARLQFIIAGHRDPPDWLLLFLSAALLAACKIGGLV